MNRTKIEWTNVTYNPLGQGCDHNCWFCYAKRGARRNYFMHLALYKKGKRKNPPCELCRDFKPHFHPERLNDPDFDRLPAGTKIFVCSTSDLFAPWTEPEWRDQVLNRICRPRYLHLIFQLLTKNPEEIPYLAYHKNVWFGVTITTQKETDKIKVLRDHIGDNLGFASFEPLLGPIQTIDLSLLNWIIIGKLTGSRKVRLQKEWVQSLIDQARTHNIPVFIKDNVGWPEKIQEFPSSQMSFDLYGRSLNR